MANIETAKPPIIFAANYIYIYRCEFPYWFIRGYPCCPASKLGVQNPFQKDTPFVLLVDISSGPTG